VDPFDLPEWLGECTVTWAAERSLASGDRIPGALSADGHDPLPCDLLGVDDAYPQPVATDPVRVRAHQLWQYGEVLVIRDAERVVLAVPGSRLDAETALEAVGRLAKAVGAMPGRYGVRLRVGADQRR
jgi:hypothetical protein